MGRSARHPWTERHGRHCRQSRLCNGDAAGYSAGSIYRQDTVPEHQGQPAAYSQHSGRYVCAESAAEDAPYRSRRGEPAEQGRA